MELILALASTKIRKTAVFINSAGFIFQSRCYHLLASSGWTWQIIYHIFVELKVE